MEVFDVLQGGDVYPQQVGIVGHHGTVIVVVRQMLVEVIGHTGVENGVDALLQQGHDVAVKELGRVTDRIRGDGLLPLEVQAPGGLRGEDHLKVQSGEQGEPEGEVLIHVQPKGNADFSPGAVPLALALEGAKILVLEFQQVGNVHFLLAQGPGTAVARDEFPTAVKAVDGQGTVVGAELTGGGPGLMGEGGQGLGGQQGGLGQTGVLGGQGRAIGPHHAGDGGAGDLPANLQLEGAQHRVVEKGAALDHNVLAQIIGAGGPNDLVDGVLYHGDGQPRGDVLHRGPVLLGLLDRGVHKDRAPGPQVHRMPGEQPHLGEVGNGVAQGLGEGFNERTTAGGAGLVEEDGVHRAVADLEAFHILAADVDDKVHIRGKVPGGVEMGHGFHQAQVAGEGVFDEVFSVAGDRGALDGHPAAALGINFPQLGQNDADGVSLVGVIKRVEKIAVRVNEHHFGGGGPGVNA